MSGIDTSDVRASWVHGEATAPFYSDEHARQAEKARAEFDAWLAEHDRQVKAEAQRECVDAARQWLREWRNWAGEFPIPVEIAEGLPARIAINAGIYDPHGADRIEADHA